VIDAAVDSHDSSSLWSDRNFQFFWSGQSLSKVGSAVNFIALPLVGVLTLELNAFEMGLIASSSRFPSVIVSPFVGHIVDSIDRKRMMIGLDIGRAILVGSVPLAAFLNSLSLVLLMFIGAGLGICTLLFSVAHDTLLPNIVKESSLADGNSKLEASESLADISGPGIAGWLVGLFGPAGALVVDAASYVGSALLLARVRPLRHEVDQNPIQVDSDYEVAGFWEGTKLGFKLLWGDSVLRTLSVSYAVLALFSQIQMAVYILFLVRLEGFSATMLGVVFSLAGAIGFVSALLAGRVANRFGTGKLAVIGTGCHVGGGAVLAAVGGSTTQAVITMLVAEAWIAAGLALYGVGSRTLYQTLVADAVRGRLIGAGRAMTGALVSISGVAGGAVGLLFGLRMALIVGAIGQSIALVILVVSPTVWNAGRSLRPSVAT